MTNEIPVLSVEMEKLLDRTLNDFMSTLEWQSDGHIRWYTHKNPYGCWICETLQVCRLLENELMDLERVIDRQAPEQEDQRTTDEPGRQSDSDT
jgi:hypothetical protein